MREGKGLRDAKDKGCVEGFSGGGGEQLGPTKLGESELEPCAISIMNSIMN